MNKSEYFEYLDDLRDTGVINMFGATPYIMEQFQITKREARDVLLAWMTAVSDGSHVCHN